MKIASSVLFAGAMAVTAGCALAPRSEAPVSDQQIASLPEGLNRAQLLATLGPPADEAEYRNLNEDVLSWRLVEPGNQSWLFNAHLDPSGRVVRYSRSLDPTAAGNQESP